MPARMLARMLRDACGSSAMPDADPPSQPPHACEVFAAAAFAVALGVNQGDPLGPPEALEPGDIYRLAAGTPAAALSLRAGPAGSIVADGSALGRPGAPVATLARCRLMGPYGDAVDILLIDAGGTLAVLPLSPLAAGVDYTLLAVEPPPPDVRLADLVTVAFARGTRITLADGQPCAIENLRPGDRVLTRDHGRQPLRHIGRATLRAVGPFAPVVISRGTLGNGGDLVVSPHHRIFLYLRERAPGLPTAELLVQAKHLCDGETVFVREGGYVDYFSLVFDRHEIIYAEGIPAESLMVNEATLTRLPAELAAELRARFPGLSHTQHFGTEADRRAIGALGPVLPPGRRGGG
jgi:hypothetical protein